MHEQLSESLLIQPSRLISSGRAMVRMGIMSLIMWEVFRLLDVLVELMRRDAGYNMSDTSAVLVRHWLSDCSSAASMTVYALCTLLITGGWIMSHQGKVLEQLTRD